MKEENINLSVLYVDLDGTFTKSDLLFESFLVAIKSNVAVLFFCLFWALKGKAYLKYRLSEIAEVPINLLPLNAELHKFLLNEKKKNRKIVLATASHEKYAKAICINHSLFHSYISSDENRNLKGEAKLSEIQSIDEIFSYAGNSIEDLMILEKSEESYLVNPNKAMKKRSKKMNISKVFDEKPRILSIWLRQLRTHQWLKNLLIFIPLIASSEFLNGSSVFLSFLGFTSFSCLASATYIINDLVDLEFDRIHPRKRSRPLAAGEISLVSGFSIALFLLAAAFFLALQINIYFFLSLTSYFFLTLAYSLKIKKYIGMDVICLASLYTIRIIAGAALLNVAVSFWLLTFSMFIFFSLAIVKRCSELHALKNTGMTDLPGRNYTIIDYPLLISLGVSSSLLAVLTFCFYVNTNVLKDQYQNPTILWITIPALGYWITRMWVKTNRGEMHDDPVIFSITDKGSILTIGFIGIIMLLGKL